MTTMLVQSAIQGLFSLTANRAGSHWLITDEEAQSISEPTANILAKYLPTDKLNSYSDPVVLLIAVVSIILPRAITSIQAKKVKPNVTRPTTIPNPPEQPKRQTNRDSEPASNTDIEPAKRYTGDPAKANVDELLKLVNNSAY